MIRIFSGRQEGKFLTRKEYYRGKSLLTQTLMQVTKRIRAYHAIQYMEPKDTHLDIGCGDGYFMKKSRCRNIFGIDSKYGDHIGETLDFQNDFFDYVTMLAVIEHLQNPGAILKESHRVLKQGGKLILTTPRQRAEKIIKRYAPNIEAEHAVYFDLESMRDYIGNGFEISVYLPFLFRLNQLFCLQKKEN